MAKIQAVWALDIGQAALKALKLVPGDEPDQVLAEAFDFIEYPKILSQPDAEPEALVREALGTFMDRNDLKGCKIAISVPGQAGLVKFIKLPPVEKKRIPDIVNYEAKQQIPFALSEVVWAYQPIGDDDGGDEDFSMVEVGLFAMKRDQINRAIAPFKAAGIEVDVVQMTPLALYNFITFDFLKGSGIKEPVVLLDMGADKTDLIITDGVRIWQRNVPIGGNHFTRALTKELKLTFAKAEHLKRNATKAPDPKAVFTAMRGVFNDYASEINRSIGFYGSVNRNAKIAKVVGLGNGFKLPGLVKFLQQNLNGLEVERYDNFAKLTGDEVKGAPQFTENLGSFAVCYGLASQGLGRAVLKTSLLPPEIEQVRMIRAKKPWVLAASALIMLGFTWMYFFTYRAYATVVNPAFKSATSAANAASTRGAGYESDYGAAKGEFDSKLAEGKALIVSDADRALWPSFLQKMNTFFPDPVAYYKLDPKNPRDVPYIDKLRIHIDQIKPVYRSDVAEWYNAIPEKFKNVMHPLDRDAAPSGEGWIIQVIGHHYNPTPTAEDQKLPPERRLSFGPLNYLYLRVLPALWGAGPRAYGVHHATLAWMLTDKAWTSDKGAAGNGSSAAAPLLARGTAATPAAGGEGGEGGYASMMSGMMGAMGGGRGGMPGAMGGDSGMMPGMMGGYAGMMGGMGGQNDPTKKKLTTLTRTDFLIQFIWQAPTAEVPAKPIEDIVKEIKEAEAKSKNVMSATEADLEKASQKASEEIIAKAQAAAKQAAAKAQQANQAVPSAAGDAAAPAAPTAPAATTPPAAAPK